jgi:hypothetical protein
MTVDEGISGSGEICPDCSAVVRDLEAHERWHTRLISDLAKAVRSEIQRGAGARP